MQVKGAKYMRKIALLTSKELEGSTQNDHLLINELSNQSYQVKEKTWETLVDEGEDLFILRSTWNYTDRYHDFINCIEKVKDRLWNPLPLVKWNANKKYLVDLFAKGLKVLPLILAKDSISLHKALEQLGGEEFILKPVFGAGAKGLKLFNRENIPALNHEVIVQRFYPEISQGEISLVYFGGQFSHAIRKTPKSGEIRVQKEYGGVFSVHQPTAEEFQCAEDVLKNIPSKWLYARVDILPGYGLMELECIEPELFFNSYKEGVKHMVDEISKIITAK